VEYNRVEYILNKKSSEPSVFETRRDEVEEGGEWVVLDAVVAVHADGVRLCLSELWPPTGLLFISQVTYEYEEP
jgi:hypothetical protein